MRLTLSALALTVASGLLLAPGAVALADASPADASPADATPPVAPAPHSNAAFSFGLVADVQYWDGPAHGTRYYADSTTKLAEAAGTINAAQVDFTVQLGDLIDRDMASFDAIVPVYQQVDGPRYHVLGNHDFPVADSQTIVDRLGMASEYYDFTHQGWRFVVLDTNDISLYANAPGSPDYTQAEAMLADLRAQGAVNAQTWDGAVGPEQRAWLQATLDDAAEKGQKVIVFGHMPLHGENAHNAWDAPQVRDILESRGNVVAYFNGHDHAGRYGEVNGIHYLNLRGMVEQPYPANSYAVVTVQANKVRVDGHGSEPDRVLRVPASAREAGTGR